jgi:hypothetical protein
LISAKHFLSKLLLRKYGDEFLSSARYNKEDTKVVIGQNNKIK